MNTPPVQTHEPEKGRADLPVRHASAAGVCESPDFYKASDLARAMKCDKKTVAATAAREQWPMRWTGNRQEFSPPPQIAHFVIAAPATEHQAQPITVKFADLRDETQRETVLRREKAVLALRDNLHLGKEVALEVTAATMRVTYTNFKCCARSLRYWDDRYTADGLDGLVEQKLGNVGRPAFADQLGEQTILRYRAAAIEHGNARKGDGKPQVNKARAYRGMIADPTLRGPERAWLHGEHASKSYVPPSVRRVLDSSPLTVSLIQRGPKAAKLDGAYTECDYENLKAGTVFTADDMTANVYVWTEWPNEQGFLLIRPQILAAMDVGSLSWLNIRAVIRPKGQYNHDDVWGLVGDVFDDFGKFEAAIFEGGTWQSKEVVGQICDDEVRFGGLRSLGCRVIHTRSPKGKVIEPEFNSLQYAADNCKGFCGRNERVDCPETVKTHLAAVRAGKAHPREFFLHISEYRAHLTAVMASLNHERKDGKICRGLCPKDKWDQDHAGVERIAFPDNAKWMYRASYRVVSATRNGVRISLGSGKYQLHYTYSHPALVPHRGRRVAVFFNDYDAHTDAVIFTIHNGKPHEQICVAPLAPTVPRLGASDEQMRAESTRKAQLASVARTERASLAPYLQRNFRTPAAQAKDGEIDYQLKAAKSASAEKSKRTRTVNQIVQDNAEDILAADADGSAPGPGRPDLAAAHEQTPRTTTNDISLEELQQL